MTIGKITKDVNFLVIRSDKFHFQLLLDIITKRWYQDLTRSEKDAIRKSFLTKADLMLINDRMKMIKFPERCLKSMPELGSHC
ncbi:hypothetical protein BLOT_010379 [Blomia tropicalis]|nr:hypothetical protein BLOT_010379 [Blomia tropicalis]